MKNLFLIILILSLSQLGYAQSSQGKIDIDNSYYEIKNDSIFLSFELSIKTEGIKSCESSIILPFIREKDNVFYFPYIQINGKNKKRMYNRWQVLQKINDKNNYPSILLDINSKMDTVLLYSIQFPFKEWMKEAKLSINQEVIGCNNQRQVFTYEVDNFNLTTPKYEINPVLAYITPKLEAKVFHKKEQIILDYPMNGINIVPDFGDNVNELARLEKIISAIKEDKYIEINHIKITGYASPEGPYKKNEYLAQGRANSLKAYLHTVLDIPQTKLMVDWIAEDWEGLERMVELSDMLYKEEVLNIIKNIGIFEGREKKLMDLKGGQPYYLMEERFFPYLRRIEYDIDYQVRPYNTKEVKDLLGKKNENISQYELLALATEYEVGSDEFNEIFDRIYIQFPEDNMARVNASAAMILRGDITKAQECLKNTSTPEGINNLGVIYLLLKETDKAADLFVLAAQQGCKEAELNLQKIKFKKQHYDRKNDFK